MGFGSSFEPLCFLDLKTINHLIPYSLAKPKQHQVITATFLPRMFLSQKNSATSFLFPCKPSSIKELQAFLTKMFLNLENN